MWNLSFKTLMKGLVCVADDTLKNKVKEREQFFWILGDEIDASENKLSSRKEDGTVPIKFDVILDCKGAIWHGLNSAKKDLKEAVIM